jgi:hypothetical protein
MTKTRVRFNLGKGPNFEKWQVKCGDIVEYYSPEDYSLVMTDCKLRNQPRTAQRIHDGENKTVCAWIDCDSVAVYRNEHANLRRMGFDFIAYNPKSKPFWRDRKGDNVDNKTYKFLTSWKRGLYDTSQNESLRVPLAGKAEAEYG